MRNPAPALLQLTREAQAHSGHRGRNNERVSAKRMKERLVARIIVRKDFLIMVLGTRMQSLVCRKRHQLGMELHQQLRLLDAFGQALFLLFQLGDRATIGAKLMQATQANEERHERRLILQLMAELPGAAEVCFEFAVRESSRRKQGRVHKLSKSQFPLLTLRPIRKGLEQC